MAANWRRSGLQGHRFETQCQQGLFAVESPLKCTLPLVICINNINSCVRCIGWLYICFTCERCDMKSITKRFTRVVANTKIIKVAWRIEARGLSSVTTSRGVTRTFLNQNCRRSQVDHFSFSIRFDHFIWWHCFRRLHDFQAKRSSSINSSSSFNDFSTGSLVIFLLKRHLEVV